jgi:cell shape-determining protein MreC
VTPATFVTISDAASPVDEIEKLKAHHAAEIERLVEVAQETVEKLVQGALGPENADRRIEELRAENERLKHLDDAIARYRAQIKSCGFTEAQAVDQLFKWQMALAGPDRSGRSGR